MKKRIIQIRDLVKIYNLSEEVSVQALKGISFDFHEGEFVSIMGASGSGKSTFMNILGFLDTPTSGTYILDGIDGSTLNSDQKAEIRNRKIGFVFQGFNLLSRTTALENVELPLMYRGGVPISEMTRRAKELLDLVGLSGRYLHHPNKLSGGEQQRVAIARALINNPAILLADEPTGNLDSKNTEEIMNLFTRLNKEMGISIIMVTHEPDVAEYSDRKVLFKDGQIVDDSPVVKSTKKKNLIKRKI
ncbi:MAG TPA: ABC transporter ATP-binding protein [Spirochaetota bacterium]|jgi:putative ABC transport system ATP-binding protein|nr:MAG: Lipoprotein-releasing system ATP-binding protein LolD [Spirochaetes bacterium ADurb.Bin218]HOK01352.1 ABC transporter ATP-binding protein [Spirochaetota bacterium]HOK92500.1 ABC transporter ATP-binding protein [Spirochaetota bacterium]HON17350.1 ABC transporter ATP-binding protein [Spirochaetota bacterium]HOV07672.1 ABC transporter ATP-binding protein [Spirochaetota bacterium]